MNRFFDEFEVGVRYPTRTRKISDEDRMRFAASRLCRSRATRDCCTPCSW